MNQEQRIRMKQKFADAGEQSALRKTDVSGSFPDNVEIWKWWQTQKFQKEQGEQEYTMIYEIDLPKILKAFVERFPNCH
jgi:hypothetical protein